MQIVFFRVAKQVVVELEAMAIEYHLLFGLEEETMMMTKVEVKKTPKRRASKKVVERCKSGMKSVFSLSLMKSSTLICYSINKIVQKEEKSSQGLRITNILISIIKKIDRVEEKMDRV